MKATGVIRRIDELGRIVIPKEIRKNLRIKEGESLEIYVDNEDKIILKKYSLMKNMEEFVVLLADSLYSLIHKNILITDGDTVLASSGPLKKEYDGKVISETLDRSLKMRENVVETHKKEISFIEEKKEECTYTIQSIIVGGDAYGLVIAFSNEEPITETDGKMITMATTFLSKYLEE